MTKIPTQYAEKLRQAFERRFGKPESAELVSYRYSPGADPFLWRISDGNGNWLHADLRYPRIKVVATHQTNKPERDARRRGR